MDRFALQLSLGYIPRDQEVSMLTAQQREHPLARLSACASIEAVLDWKRAAGEVRVSDELKHYMVELAAATRVAPGVRLGASPRGSLALMKCSQALALFDGMEFVTPDHVQEIAIDVLAHRILLDPQAQFSGLTGRTIVQEILQKLPAPA